MPGTQWHRSFQGRHAAVVHKERVTILFEIQMSVANLEQPLFVARDFHEGLFCKRLSATSAGALEKAWLSQNRIDGDPEISLSNMKGASFMGLDIPGFTNYLAGLVPSFQGARLREKERGRSKEDIGLRQKRRLKASLLEDFEAALGKACPEDWDRAFELLQSSQSFQSRFLPHMHYRFAQDDKSTQTLVDMYKEAVSKQDKKQAQWVLALYSPFHSQEHTMKLFQCSEHACKQANLAHRIRNLPSPEKRCTVTVLTKETVEHMDDFALRSDNCQRAAFSDTKQAKFHLVMNRNRLFLKYTDECKRLCVKAMGATTFYEYYDKGIFKNMTRQTCCCTQCVNKGGVAFDILRELCTAALGQSSSRTSLLNSIQNLEHFFERYYRGMLQIDSDDCNMCMTHALSKADDENGRIVCHHEHSPKCEVIRQDVALLHALREAITMHSNDTDRKDHLWSLDRAQGLLNE